MTEIQNANKIKGQIVPLSGNFLPGDIQPLPKYFSDTIPRNNIGTEIYSVINHTSFDFQTGLTAYIDSKIEKEVHLFFPELDFSLYYE